jgi:flagellar biosynthesis component FlhA
VNIKLSATIPAVIIAAFAVVLLAVVSTAYAPIVGAQATIEKKTEETKDKDDSKKAEEAKKEQKNDEKKDEKKASREATYEYVTQAGDSYSKIARKAVQTYGLKYDVNLSQAQIVYAETNLTLEAGSPELNTGEAVEVAESKIEAWVEKAEKLSAEQKAAWQPYTVNVNFNTDNVGQTS